MNDSNSPMPLSRQLRYQKQCRDNWKENSAKKQQTIREYVQLTRSLKKSRDRWKARAKQAEQRVKELEKQLAQFSPPSHKNPQDSSSTSSEEHEGISDRIPHHHYTIPTISIALTLELGNSKALVIYGIPQTLWLTQILPHKRALKHTDGQILALEVTTEATSDWIHSVLDSVSQKVGVPFQIIADHASNLRKGIQLFQAHYAHVISTYDVTHALANLLKKELFSDDIFSNFLSDCHHCRLQVQQTELAFAAPPAQRTQCRFFNLDRLQNWATHLLHSNFSLFSSLLPHSDKSRLFNRLLDKFAWLFSYQEPIQVWSYLLQMTRTLEKQLKLEGLNSSSLSLFQRRLSQLKLPSFLNPFKDKLFHYLETEVSLASHNTLIATSDVLESLFGRYKYFSQRCPLQELRSMLLTIPLSTINFTNQLIRDALTTVRSSDLSQWVNNTFGQSLLSKRKILFST